jgi:hypothetical protein
VMGNSYFGGHEVTKMSHSGHGRSGHEKAFSFRPERLR